MNLNLKLVNSPSVHLQDIAHSALESLLLLRTKSEKGDEPSQKEAKEPNQKNAEGPEGSQKEKPETPHSPLMGLLSPKIKTLVP